MKNIRKFLLAIFILGLLVTTTSRSFVPVSLTYTATKTVFQKAWKFIINYKHVSSASVPGLKLDPAIKLTYQNGGSWIAKWAKNPSVIGKFKGLTAKTKGDSVKTILQRKDLTKGEKIRWLNVMKANEYITNSGGINVYKSLPRDLQKFYRKEATNYMNELIKQAQPRGLVLLKAWK